MFRYVTDLRSMTQGRATSSMEFATTPGCQPAWPRNSSRSRRSGEQQHDGQEEVERTKPHVNIGTIGHIDHGKTSLTAAITKYLALKGEAEYRAFESIDNAPEERERGITIAIAHVEYETDARHLRPRRLPGPRRLHQEHDRRRGADGRRHHGGGRHRRADAPGREHILLATEVGVPYIVVFLNKVDMVGDEACSTSSSWRS